MSTTMPSRPSSGRRISTSTTYVAPCSRCAGPKTSPRKLCAIMKWPRTVTLYIPNPVAKGVACRCGETRHDARQLVERALACDERIERRVFQYVRLEEHTSELQSHSFISY